MASYGFDPRQWPGAEAAAGLEQNFKERNLENNSNKAKS